MADENRAPKPLGDRPEDHDPGLFAAQDPGPGVTPAQSEWTASDERGALHQAPAAPDFHDTEPAPAAVGPAAVPPPRTSEPTRSLWPVAVGVIVGAIIGAGSAAIVYGTQKGSDSGLAQKVASLGSRVDGLDQRPDPQPAIASLKGSVASLDGKVAQAQQSAAAAERDAQKAAAAKPPSFDPSSLQQKVSGLQNDVDGLRKLAAGGKDTAAKIGALQAAIDDLRKQDSAQGGKLGAVQSSIAGLEKQDADEGKTVAGLETAVSDLKKQDSDQGGKIAAFAATAAGLQSLQGKVSGLEKQASATQAGLSSLQGDQKILASRVKEPALGVVADSLVEQIAGGEPYASQVDALASLGADPAEIAVLRENASKGVPSAQALADQFKPLADPMTAVAYKAPANAGFMERLQSGMSSLVSVRSTDATTGDDLASHVSLIEADLAHGDVLGAVATWNALPPDAKAKSQAWGALAKTSAEAMTAARNLRQQAIETLGGKTPGGKTPGDNPPGGKKS